MPAAPAADSKPQSGTDAPKRGCLSRASRCVDGTMQSGFYHLGLLVGGNPWLTILFSVLFIGVCLAGVTQYNVENEGEKLWVPPNSIGLKQLRSVRDLFPASARTSSFYFLPKGAGTSPDSGVGALNWEVVETMFEVEEIVRSISVEEKYKPEDASQTWNFANLCQKVDVPAFLASAQRPPETNQASAGPPSTPGGSFGPSAPVSTCYVTGLTDLWAGNKTLAMLDRASGRTVVDVLNTALRTSTNGTILSPRTGRPIIFNTTFGGVRFGSGGNVTGAAVALFSFQLENRDYRDPAAGTDVDPPAEKWELELASTLKVDPQEQTFTGAKLLFGIPESDSKERSSAITGDIAFVGASIMLILVFLAVQLRVDCSCVGSRIGLALAGGLTVGMSLGFAYGIGSLMAPYTTVHAILPFILAGIGVDDLFVVTNEFALTDKTKSRRVRMAEALKHAGPSITVTTLTDFLAFFIGSTTVLPAFSAFCQWAGMAILGVYLLACTFFAACVVIDSIRQEAGRADICCCVTCRDPEATEGGADTVAANPASVATGKGGTPAVDGAAVPASKSEVDSADSSKSAASTKSSGGCCGEDATRECIVNCYGPAILNPFSKVAVVVAFLGFAGATGWASQYTSQEFREEWFIPAASPLQEQVQVRDKYFGENGVPVSGYAVNFTLGNNRNLLLDVESAMRANKWINTELGVTSWYREFVESEINATEFTELSNEEFHSRARSWLASPANVRFNSSLVWGDASKGYVRAARVSAFYVGTSTAEQEIAAMTTLRDDVTAVEKARGRPADTVFASSFVYSNWEQLVVIPSEAIQNIGLAIAACFVVVLIFIAHPTTAILVTLAVALVLVDILGVCTWWDVSLNGVSVVNLTLAIGLSVDYSAHIAHAFMHKHGTRNERVTLALSEMGVSVINGGASTFLAVVVLAASNSYIFTVFFKVFFLSVVFGLAHGLVFLPVVLSIIGPDAHEDFTPQEEQEAAESATVGTAKSDAEMARVKPATSTAPQGGMKSLQSRSAQ
ncbi:hypothetical protein FNF31_06937 [Cafeteria roenbergensis]|uniref:SSD domain-containing protein n=1 Tax=Cafeteria roenbergensis TaxID=33653 RepID=A0A5A8CD18_CAFRO|nr:hypothetical protein FNF31_06937 [Cafeteria roenbergensis]